jgi:hypothetical protein
MTWIVTEYLMVCTEQIVYGMHQPRLEHLWL